MKPNRTRLSLEPTFEDKQDIIDHGNAVGTKSIIGSIRIAISRSLAIQELLAKGGRFVFVHKNGRREDVRL